MLTIWHMSLSVFPLHSLILSGRRISTSFDVQTPGIWIWMGPVQNWSKHIESAKVDCIENSRTNWRHNKKQWKVYCKHLHLAQGWNSAFSTVICAFSLILLFSNSSTVFCECHWYYYPASLHSEKLICAKKSNVKFIANTCTWLRVGIQLFQQYFVHFHWYYYPATLHSEKRKTTYREVKIIHWEKHLLWIFRHTRNSFPFQTFRERKNEQKLT